MIEHKIQEALFHSPLSVAYHKQEAQEFFVVEARVMTGGGYKSKQFYLYLRAGNRTILKDDSSVLSSLIERLNQSSIQTEVGWVSCNYTKELPKVISDFLKQNS